MDYIVQRTRAQIIAGRVLRSILTVAILAGGFLISRYWLRNRPIAQRQPSARESRFVEISAMTCESRTVVITAMGEVVPVRQVDVMAEVSGRIVELNPAFVPGGMIKAGEDMVRIDPADYILAQARAKAALDIAKAELAQEAGRRSVAQLEYELLGRDVDESDRMLILREPQSITARASVDSALAALENTEIDIDRTRISLPFDTIVRSRAVELGSRVGVGGTVASLAGVDEFWIEISVPVSDLHWLCIPGFNAETGSEVRVLHEQMWGANVSRMGTVHRLQPDLEPAGRMARLLIRVSDPLDLTKPPALRNPLLLGAYVRVELTGRMVENVVAINRDHVHDGDNVWIMSDDGTLDIRQIEIIWDDRFNVYAAADLLDGAKLVTSNLPAPVQGMMLRTNVQPDENL